MSRWSHLLTDTITFAAQSGRSGWNATVGSQATAPARVELVNETVRGVDDEEVIITHRIATQAPLAVGTRVWVPGASTASTAESVQVKTRDIASPPGDTQTLYELRCG